VDLGGGDPGQLRNPSTDVITLWIEAFRLSRRVKDAVGIGVGSGSCDPLPVQLVAGHVAVDQMLHEVACPYTPVKVKVFDEERCSDHAGTIVHKTLSHQLPHAGIDQRKSRLAVLPGSEGIRVISPHVATIPVGSGRRVRASGQNLEEEISPTELSQEGATRWMLRGGQGHLKGRQAPKMKISREERGPLIGRSISAVFVAVDWSVQPS
tara:strand:- start:79 stop:705 length:627 start_codon:yes stop_codon:yes gene_type:complete